MNIPIGVRSYLYGIIIAAAPIAVALGLVTDNDVLLWVVLGQAILGLGAGTAARLNLEPTYPKTQGEVVVIGPETFKDIRESRISHQGQNYYLGMTPPGVAKTE